MPYSSASLVLTILHRLNHQLTYHLFLFKLHQVLYLPLFLEVLLVSGVLLVLFCFFLLFDCVVLEALLGEHFFLLTDLLDPFDPGLFFEVALELFFFSLSVQYLSLSLTLVLIRLHEAARMRIIPTEMRLSNSLACLCVLCVIE